MEDRTMKKAYIAPQMETYYIQPTDALLTTSVLTPVDGGGGNAGSRLFDDLEETGFFQGNEDMETLFKELGM